MTEPAEEITTEQLRTQIETIIRSIPDLTTIKLRDLRNRLEKHFNCDLLPKKLLIRQILQDTMQQNASQLTAQHQRQIRQSKKAAAAAENEEVEMEDEAEWNEEPPSEEDKGSDYSESERTRKEQKRTKKRRSKRGRHGRKDESDSDEDYLPNRKLLRRRGPRKPNGFMQPLKLSAPLAQICGEEVLARPMVVKAIWKYIKEHHLQDPSDKRYILCDEPLRAIFETDRVMGFGMNKIITKHLTKLAPEELAEATAAAAATTETTTTTTTTTAEAKGEEAPAAEAPAEAKEEPEPKATTEAEAEPEAEPETKAEEPKQE